MLDFLQLSAAFLVLVRISAFTITAPFFSIKGIPVLTKVGFAVLLTFLTIPFVPQLESVNSVLVFMLLVGKEVMTGILLGFTTNLVLQAVRIGGEMIDLQMGFAMARVLDPQSGTQVTLMGNVEYTFAILLFFVFNGHHALILAIVKSFQLVPLGAGSFGGDLAQQLVSLFVGMFAVAFKIAAPVLAVLLISDISLGLVARTVPQLNVFILGFPIKAGLGMLVVALVLPMLAGVISDLLVQMEKDLILIMESLV